MRFRTAVSIIGLLALPAALPGPVAANHKPGHNPGGATGLTIAAKPTPIVFGSATVVSGRLNGANNAGVTVTLRENPYPFTDGTNKPVRTTVTNTKGEYSFTRRPLLNTIFTATAGPTRSPAVTVNVRIRMSLRVSDSTPRVGQRVRFRGRACPTHNGLIVAIQRRSSTGRYRTVRRTRLKAATRCSVYSRTFRIYRDGRYRATADDANHARGYSRSRVLNAHR